MLNLEFQESTLEQIEGIFSFVAQDNPVSAVDVIQRIYHTIENLRVFPYLGKTDSGILREIIEPRYKFRIIYLVRDNTIYIVSIFKHQNY